MRILALDPAGITGWCMGTDKKLVYGNWICSETKKGKTTGKPDKMFIFHQVLTDYITDIGVDLVVYEKPGGSHYNGLRAHSNLEGIIFLVAKQKGILIKEYSATSIKKFITGKGNAKKELVIQAVKDRGYFPEDDNTADAIALYLLAKSELDDSQSKEQK